MAIAGQILTNQVSGEKLQYIETAKDTNGQLTKFNLWVSPKGYMPVRHLHPQQTERFEVVSGVFKVECAGKIIHLQPGEKFFIEKGIPHQWWNESEQDEAHVVITLEPALNFEIMQEQIFGICNSRGELSFLQIMAMAKEYEMIIAGPPIWLQQVMWAVLGPIGRMLGYKKYYPEYSG